MATRNFRNFAPAANADMVSISTAAPTRKTPLPNPGVRVQSLFKALAPDRSSPGRMAGSFGESFPVTHPTSHRLHRRPRRIALALAALAGTATPLALAVLPAAPAAAQQAGQDDLQQVNAYIRAVTTMTANFSQTDRAGQTLTGTLTLKQPGKIRFQYQKGVPLLVVGDGKALTVIDYEVRQVQRWPIGNSPLAALIDPTKDLAKFGRIVQTGDPNVLSVEARDPRRPEFGTITMIFQRKASAPAGLELYGWVALDSQNNRTSVRLSGQQYGVAVPDSAFRWTDPRPKGRATG
jgi:outer membrane lipoprotein-sorting protein